MIAHILTQEDIVIIEQWDTSSTFHNDSLFKADKQHMWHCSITAAKCIQSLSLLWPLSTGEKDHAGYTLTMFMSIHDCHELTVPR